MNWETYLIIATIWFFSAISFAIIRWRTKYKSGRLLDPLKILIAGVALSAVTLFIPIYSYTFKETGCGIVETMLISIHNMIRLFIVDGEFEFVTKNLADITPTVFTGYTHLFSVLFTVAPILTFGFVMSFFKNVAAYARYILHFGSDTFIFSELNEKSLALAESLSKNKKRFIVFTDVREKEEEHTYEMTEKAKEIGAVCFKKDILTVNFSFHSKNKEMSFFAIGENQSENISQALKIISKFGERDKTNLYVFSTQIESEMLLANAFNTVSGDAKIKVRRVDEVQSLIFRTLYEDGYEKIFNSAYYDGAGVNRINAVIIGMGQHGTEMTKTLAWFCQMDGYQVEINSFDLYPIAEDKFISKCPELMKLSGADIEGEPKYTINVHSGINVDGATFDKIIESLPRTTYVLVALGNDEMNIATAVKLRSLFERMGQSPVVQAIVYKSEKKEALSGICNFKRQEYKIDFIGDMKTSYSEEVILDSDVEKEALARHMKWPGSKESEFWRYNYNYKSSVASAIHKKMKKLCGVAGVEKDPDDRTEKELWGLRRLEHNRWNAYMRSEGYVYGGTIEKSGRNDLAKMHNCLVPFDQLPLSEQEKDDD